MIVLLFLSRRISTVTLRLDCDLSVDQHTISTQQPSKLSVQLRLGR
jgi:hypothetical protein